MHAINPYLAEVFFLGKIDLYLDFLSFSGTKIGQASF